MTQDGGNLRKITTVINKMDEEKMLLWHNWVSNRIIDSCSDKQPIGFLVDFQAGDPCGSPTPLEFFSDQ